MELNLISDDMWKPGLTLIGTLSHHGSIGLLSDYSPEDIEPLTDYDANLFFPSKPDPDLMPPG